MITIADVRFRYFEAPLDCPIELSFGTLRKRTVGLVEIRSTDGAVGVGETWLNFPPWAAAERAATIRSGLTPLLLGRTVDHVPSVSRALREQLLPLGRQAGAIGPIVQSLSGVDIALWDLLAKTRGLPVSAVIDPDADARNEVEAYGSGITNLDLEALCLDSHRMGFTTVKCRVGFGAEGDEMVVEASHRLLPGVAIAADANKAWTYDEAAGFLTTAGSDLAWIEEPLTTDNIREHERLYETTGVPIALGENAYSLTELLPFLESDLSGICQPDISKIGGISEFVAVCDAAEQSGKRVAAHLYGGPVALCAALHVAAVRPVVQLIEWDLRDNPLRHLVNDSPQAEAGYVPVPHGPGLGLNLNPNVSRQYETWVGPPPATEESPEPTRKEGMI